MLTEELTLVKPGPEYEAEYRALLAEYQVSGEDCHAGKLLKALGDDFAAFLYRLKDEERRFGLPPGIVPQTTFWLIRNGATILGESRIRHRLTPLLECEGGHIGYAIRPSERRKGYGTCILALTLEKARTMGLKRVLLTCETENIGSAKIIRFNGGIFAGESISMYSGKPVSKYWIDLSSKR